MKKKSTFFCIALTFTISVSSQTPNQHTRVHRQNIIEKKVAIRKAELHTDVENENLKGKVKEFTDTEFKASKINGKLVKGKLFQSRVDEYDTSGNLTSRAYYDSSMKLFMKTLYTYSKRGLKTKEVLLDNKQEVVLTKTYEYDANDYLTTEITFHRNGDQSNQVPYTYQYPDEYTVIQITTTPDVFT